MLELFYHPFSSYSQKVLIALWENEIPFEGRVLGPEYPENGAAWQALWPVAQFPVLRDGGRTVVEATAIIEHLEVHHRGRHRFIPDDPAAAADVRMWDRIFDNHVSTPQQTIVFDARRPPESRDPYGVAEARKKVDTVYAWLDSALAGRRWACGDSFTLADCAAAPALFYADWTHPFDGRFPTLAAYRARLNAWPSFARAIEGGRPYRNLFPLGAPDRD